MVDDNKKGLANKIDVLDNEFCKTSLEIAAIVYNGLSIV